MALRYCRLTLAISLAIGFNTFGADSFVCKFNVKSNAWWIIKCGQFKVAQRGAPGPDEWRLTERYYLMMCKDEKGPIIEVFVQNARRDKSETIEFMLKPTMIIEVDPKKAYWEYESRISEVSSVPSFMGCVPRCTDYGEQVRFGPTSEHHLLRNEGTEDVVLFANIDIDKVIQVRGAKDWIDMPIREVSIQKFVYLNQVVQYWEKGKHWWTKMLVLSAMNFPEGKYQPIMTFEVTKWGKPDEPPPFMPVSAEKQSEHNTNIEVKGK